MGCECLPKQICRLKDEIRQLKDSVEIRLGKLALSGADFRTTKVCCVVVSLNFTNPMNEFGDATLIIENQDTGVIQTVALSSTFTSDPLTLNKGLYKIYVRSGSNREDIYYEINNTVLGASNYKLLFSHNPNTEFIDHFLYVSENII